MLKIFNTLTREKEIFKPIREGKVDLYACGVTVYDLCHLGHARTYTAIDVIVRYLKFKGYEVNYVRNITDIDDKIIKRAAENKEEVNDVTERFIKAMNEDFAKLNLSAPNVQPRAMSYVAQMVDLIEKIIKNGHAYVGENGDVYFDVKSFAEYGALSHHDIDQLESGARVSISEVKRDPLDFVLWKLAKPNEPSWDSPWGKGRPGWHIECSAMCTSILGTHFDLHAGGRDLIFPHHENEIAQSKAATHAPFANTWLHTGFLQIDKEKMSKSLGNFVTIRDVMAIHDAETLRYFFVASHYRSPSVYTEEVLIQSKQALTRLYTALRFLEDATPIENTIFERNFIEAMDDDFNAPVAMSHLFELAHEIQRLRDKDLESASKHAALLKRLASVFGLLQKNVEDFFQAGSDVDVAKIERLIAERNAARQNKNWQEADRVRQELASMSIAIEDTANGTTWKKITLN